MKAGVRINTDSQVSISLRITLHFILILGISFAGLALFSNSIDYFHTKSFIKDESSVKQINLDNHKEKSLAPGHLNFNLYELPVREFNLANVAPFYSKLIKRLHSRSPPLI